MGCDKEFCGILSGLQEVANVDTQAKGKVKAFLDGKKLTVSGWFKNLSSALFPVGDSAAHIHLGAPGANGAVIFELKISASSDNKSGVFKAHKNVFKLTEAQRDTLKAGNYYVNIHTVQYQSGEIRAQFLPKMDECKQFLVVLSGANEVPTNESEATGTLIATLNCDRLVLSGTFSGLGSELLSVAGSAGHIHQAVAGQTGPVVFPLTIVPDEDNLGGSLLRADNKFKLSRAQRKTLKNEGFYVNIHTVDFPNGEIRAQLVPLSW